jgi:hypothetical protein
MSQEQNQPTEARPEKEPRTQPPNEPQPQEQQPGHPRTEYPPGRREGVVSNPDPGSPR